MEIKLISLYICVVFKSPVSPNGVTNFILSLKHSSWIHNFSLFFIYWFKPAYKKEKLVKNGYQVVVVPEWLSGMTRNHVGSARAGSNPADHVFYFISFYFFFCFFFISPSFHFPNRTGLTSWSCKGTILGLILFL
jgi:hypothetical protein